MQDFSDDLKKRLLSGSVSALDKSTDAVFAEMQNTCPFLSGHLKGTGRITGAKKGTKEVYASVEYSADYAIFAEYRRMWMRRAGIAKEKETMKNFEDIA